MRARAITLNSVWRWRTLAYESRPPLKLGYIRVESRLGQLELAISTSCPSGPRRNVRFSRTEFTMADDAPGSRSNVRALAAWMSSGLRSKSDVDYPDRRARDRRLSFEN